MDGNEEILLAKAGQDAAAATKEIAVTIEFLNAKLADIEMTGDVHV